MGLHCSLQKCRLNSRKSALQSNPQAPLSRDAPHLGQYRLVFVVQSVAPVSPPLPNCLPILKKTTASKRTVPPCTADYTIAFLKDWQRLSHSGRYDMVRLKDAMLLLIANDAPLIQEWLDHPLKGQWADHRECHIGGDFLLIYQVQANWINFVRAGTHAELFGS